MTRRYRKWLPYEVAALGEWAGTVPTAEIAERLGRSAKSVDHKAKAMGLSLRCEWHLEWCNGCSCWRTSVDADTGECQVCKVRHKMQATEAECTALYLALGPDSKGQRGGVMPGKRSNQDSAPAEPQRYVKSGAPRSRAAVLRRTGGMAPCQRAKALRNGPQTAPKGA